MSLQTKEFSVKSTKGNHKFILKITENSIDNQNNTSSVSWKFSIARYDLNAYPCSWKYQSTVPVQYTITINGNAYNGNIMQYDGKSTVELKSGSFTIKHDDNGDKSINYKFLVSSNVDKVYLPGSAEKNGTMALTTISRASTITSASNTIIGDACTVKWEHKVDGYKYKLGFFLSGTGWYTITDWIVPNTVGSYTEKYVFASDDDTKKEIYELKPNSASFKMLVRLYTYDGNGSSLGKSDKSFTATIPPSVKPTVGSISIDPPNVKFDNNHNGIYDDENDGNYNILIKNKNKIRIYVGKNRMGNGTESAPGIGSKIASCKISGPSLESINNTNLPSVEFNGSPVNVAGELTYKVTVTDTRGRSSSTTVKTVCYDCYSPKFTRFSLSRRGKKLTCKYKVSYAEINQNGTALNSVSINVYVDGELKTTVVKSSGTLTIDLPTEEDSYKVYATATDSLGNTSQTSESTVYGASKVINVTSDGTGVAFGMKAEQSNLLQSRYKIKAPGLTSSRGTRPDSANIAPDSNYTGCLEYYLSTEDMEEGKPTLGNGHIMHFHWDATSGYDSQLFVNAAQGALQTRGCNQGTWGEWRTHLDDKNYSVQLFSGPSTSGTVTITLAEGDSLDNYKYVEIFYTTNQDYGNNSTRVYSPNGKKVCLSFVEPAESTSLRTYLKRTTYTVAGNNNKLTITPNINRSGYVQIDSTADSTTLATTEGSNYIKIVRVLGYKI